MMSVPISLSILYLVFCISEAADYTPFNPCKAKPIGAKYRWTNGVSGYPLLENAVGRSLLECLSVCDSTDQCFSVIHIEETGRCDLYSVAINQLGLPDKSVKRGSAIAANLPDRPNDTSVESCLDRCGETACRTDCGYDPPQPLCFTNLRHCPENQYNNLDYHFFQPIEWNGASGTVKSVVFNKKYETSSLRVIWRGDMMTPCGGDDVCIRYSLTINGQDCEDPGPLESLHHKVAPRNNGHRADGIEGVCNGITAGNVTVSFVTSECPDDYTTGVGSVGHVSTSWMLIQEVDIQPQKLQDPFACSGISSYNLQQFVTYDYIQSTNHYQFGENMTYLKKEDDTAVVVTFNGGFYEMPHSDGTYQCARWYYKFNGEECVTPGPADMIDEHRERNHLLGLEHRYGIWKVVCSEIPAGPLVISLHTGDCKHSGVNYGLTTTGFTSTSGNRATRFIVEEVHVSSPISTAVVKDDEKYTRIPFFNLQYFAWVDVNNEQSNGIVLSMTYNKISATSGLRLEYNGNLRSWKYDNTCCRYYFTIDDQECTSPGHIEGIIEESVGRAHRIRQGTVDGICTGIPAGSRSIHFRTSKCSDQNGVSRCSTGRYSTTNIFISEVNF